jgi:hypothetical protein
VGIAVAVGTVAVLVTVLVYATPFTLTLHSGGCAPRTSNHTFPIESTVTFTWSTPNGTPVKLRISSILHGDVYAASGTSGGGSFVATVGNYSFNATSCPPTLVELSGRYTTGSAFFGGVLVA